MSRPSSNCSKKALNDYIFYLETESEEYLIDHYNESPLIINGDGQMWWKGYWLTYTDKEKKAHLDQDIDKYFGRPLWWITPEVLRQPHRIRGKFLRQQFEGDEGVLPPIVKDSIPDHAAAFDKKQATEASIKRDKAFFSNWPTPQDDY